MSALRTWDAESQLTVTAGSTYLYDGDGCRVAKANTATPPVPYKLYWYGSGGDILAETDSSGNATAEYIFFGGKRIAMLPAGGNPEYYVEDLLGTSRVISTNSGVVCYDADFYPYGGERAPYLNNCPSTNNYKFEGKERDTETGNDDFGARYYSNRYGRWLSADWSAVPVPVPYANLTNPQTLNLYAMVADDPESFADLDGHEDGKGESGSCSAGGCSAGTDQQTTSQQLSQIMSQTITIMNGNGTEASVMSGIEKEVLNALAGLANASLTLDDPNHTHTPQAPMLEGSNTTEKVAMVTTAVALVVAPFASEAKAGEVGIQANRAAGNAFRDEVASSLKAAGRDVKTEVSKQTPFGRRVIDIEVKHNGKTLGGVETKTGRSPYKASQRAKDAYLKQKGYPVNLVRKPPQ